jgi:hypothetical protein
MCKSDILERMAEDNGSVHTVLLILLIFRTYDILETTRFEGGLTLFLFRVAQFVL